MLPLTWCLHFKRDPKENIMLKPKEVLLTRLSVQRFILVMVSMRLHQALPLKGGPWSSEPLCSLLTSEESAQAYRLESSFFLKDPHYGIPFWYFYDWASCGLWNIPSSSLAFLPLWEQTLFSIWASSSLLAVFMERTLLFLYLRATLRSSSPC